MASGVDARPQSRKRRCTSADDGDVNVEGEITHHGLRELEKVALVYIIEKCHGHCGVVRIPYSSLTEAQLKDLHAANGTHSLDPINTNRKEKESPRYKNNESGIMDLLQDSRKDEFPLFGMITVKPNVNILGPYEVAVESFVLWCNN